MRYVKLPGAALYFATLIAVMTAVTAMLLYPVLSVSTVPIVAKIIGIVVVFVFLGGLTVGAIGAYKLLPYCEERVSVDGGETWIVVHRGGSQSHKEFKEKAEKIIKKEEEKRQE